jgi:hypothetical protein
MRVHTCLQTGEPGSYWRPQQLQYLIPCFEINEKVFTFQPKVAISTILKMVFESKFPKVDPPSTDVFNFIFNTAREKYPKDKVLYRVHETGETLTLEELENKSLRLASVLVKKYGIKPNHVIAFLANNSVSLLCLIDYEACD